MFNKRGNESFLNFKKGIVVDYLPWLLIAVAVLGIIVIAIFVMKGKGIEIISNIKNMFGGR